MKRWLGLFGIVALMAVAALLVWRWQNNLIDNRFGRVRNGMTLEEVRAVMGRREDYPEEGETLPDSDGKTRSWVDQRDFLCVDFDPQGKVAGKQIVPAPKSSRLPHSK